MHVERAVFQTHLAANEVKIGHQIVDVGHHAPHDTEPHVMVGVDESRHNDAFRSVDDFGAVRLDVRADRSDPVSFHKHIAGNEIWDRSIHRDDGAALEEGDGSVLGFHGRLRAVRA